MTDITRATSTGSALPSVSYPFDAPPTPGNALEVAPGVHWIRMPLPYSLDHINVWTIADGDGRAIVDTGARTDAATALWRRLCTGPSSSRPVTRVFVTHMHPDHVGMAGWLTRTFDCRLWMTRLEYLNCRVAASDTGREAPDDGVTSTVAQAGAQRRSSFIAHASAASGSTSTRCRTASGACRTGRKSPSANTSGGSSSARAIRPSTRACTARR